MLHTHTNKMKDKNLTPVTKTKAEKKRIMDSVPTYTMSDAQWGEALGWTHTEARNRNITKNKYS